MCFPKRERNCESCFHESQVRTREPSCGLLLAFLRCVDVWRDTVGDVHLLRGALVRADGQTGTCMSSPCQISERGICPRPSSVLFRCHDSGFWFSMMYPRLNSDPVASRAGRRATRETTRLPARDVQRHEEVLGLQSVREAQLYPTGHTDSRGWTDTLIILKEYDMTDMSLCFWNGFSFKILNESIFWIINWIINYYF